MTIAPDYPQQTFPAPEPLPTPPAPEAPPSLEELERRRLRAERQALPDRLSIVVQPRHVPARTDSATQQHFAEIELLPGFSVDDARKLKGGEGAQFRTDAVRMVEVETARVAQLHSIVGVDDVWLSLDGVIMDPADWTGLDAALATAQAQVIAGEDEGDSDVKEITIVSLCLQETARYQAMAGAEQVPPPPDPLVREEGESDDAFQRRGEAWRQYQLRHAARDSVLPRDPPVGQTYEPQSPKATEQPQWKQG